MVNLGKLPILWPSRWSVESSMFASIRIGTSGFAYDDWVGGFYPRSIKPPQRLLYYAQHFKTVEINSTFYQLPALPSVYGMLRKVPEDFDFIVKAHRDLTHGTRARAQETLSKFRVMLEAYRTEHKLGGVLIQFPMAFLPSADNVEYLRWLVDCFESQTRLVIEFRHAKWFTEETMAFLRELRAALCIVDMPQVLQLPTSRIEVTGPIAYFRFHGQNAREWEKPSTRDERYDYEYSESELSQWVEPIATVAKQAEQTYVFFNNHYRGKAARNAITLQKFLTNRFGQVAVGT